MPPDACQSMGSGQGRGSPKLTARHQERACLRRKFASEREQGLLGRLDARVYRARSFRGSAVAIQGLHQLGDLHLQGVNAGLQALRGSIVHFPLMDQVLACQTQSILRRFKGVGHLAMLLVGLRSCPLSGTVRPSRTATFEVG